MQEEPKIRIETREELIYLLAEAAAIEHNLMCCYLYAAWSLKRGTRDGLSEKQAEAVERWKRAITSVAVEEMTHLALASNLATAIGGAPHFSRPNFPIAPGYHPAGVVVELAGFSRAVLDHFIFLERPEGKELRDATEFTHPTEYHRTQPRGRLMPHAQDYNTVGHLYRGIRHGFEVLAHHIGEPALFCGEMDAQLSQHEASLPGLLVVKDLATAEEAIETIIEQGEGAPQHSENSHYSRFLRVRDEYEAFIAEDPSFAPAFPVAHNPVMRRPLDPHERVFIDSAEAAKVLDLANAVYGHALRSLVQAFGRAPGDDKGRRLFADVAIDLMFVLTKIGPHLASLPASPSHPGVNAGVTFSTLRDVQRLPPGTSEMRIMAERAAEIATHARHVFPAGHELDGLAARLTEIMGKFGVAELKTVTGGSHPLPVPPAPDDVPQAAAETAPGVREEIPGKDVTILYEGTRCIHARFCVLGAPAVFKANTPGEWIFPDAMDKEAVVRIAHACPSGAIRYKRNDGIADEQPPPVNIAGIRENGPYALRAELKIGDLDVGFRATLCRCGASKRKPFCDGSHNAIGFHETGEPATRESKPLAVRNGPLTVHAENNGPLVVTGNLEICSGTGRTIDRVTRARLCRCGGSRNKPFCDNTHLRNGFQAPEV